MNVDYAESSKQALPIPAAPARPGKWRTFYRKLRKNKMAMVGGAIIVVYVLTALFGPLFTTHDPFLVDLPNKLKPPSAEHWLGTDDKGRDMLSRIILGARLSMGVGFVAVLIGAVCGTVLGLLAGYYGKWTDTIIMRVIDILLAFPGILLALAIVSALGPSLVNVMIAIGAFSVPMFARIARGSALTVKKLEYIDAIRSLGSSDLRIICLHIFPNITSPLIVQATLRLATAILTAAGLSFLGLGAQPPLPEWGAMLSSGRDFLFTQPQLALYPGLAISMLVIAFNVFGDGLRDALDPRMKH
ncbi:nickel transporter permease [Paenibacillus thalictri]|uniref:ABC transporter permease n=1 Tax=Paenibacillus thalictri TaxID=2527873 RepID=A0A4V2J3L5_9BACL|nr:nickel transporter permease [Paenibacillus thalictri]TBL73317.1 ABC transporter permease [Paenibacillus thalictri]